jgi:hypothetical protein
MTTDPRTYFNTTLPAILASNPRAKMANTKFAVDVTGPTGGKWFIDLTVPSVTPGDPPASVPPSKTTSRQQTGLCSITIADADLPTLVDGTLQDMLRLKAKDKLVLGGNTLMALRLHAVFAMKPSS